MRRCLLLFALGVVACGHRAREHAPRPRIVALVVIDQLGEWAWQPRVRASDDGIARAVKGGREFVAQVPYAATATGPGHAAFGTGAPPSVNGIVGNEIWDAATGKIIDTAKDAKGVSSSARVRVDGVADVLLREHPGAHAVGVALKDRSALFSLGHAGVAIWYDADLLRMVSNGARPAWLDELADEHPLAPLMHATWMPLDPARVAALSGSPDDAPGELSVPGWTARFPHVISEAKHPHKAFAATPYADRAVADAAIAAIRGEHLGDDDVPDLLVVSFSGHDYIAHSFGPDSWEAWDAWLRLDRAIGDLERALDDAAGPGDWTMIVTADHGGPSTPEHRRAQGLPGARYAFEDLQDVAQKAAVAAVGPGTWIAASRFPTLWLTDAAKALPADRRAMLVDAAIAAVAAMPGMQRAGASAALTGQCETRTGDERAICLSLDAERSGEIFYLPGPGTVLGKRGDPDATDHGSLNDYDRDVPLVVVGSQVHAGTVPGMVSPLQIAPTLAALLGVSPPPAAREPPLPLL